MAISGSLEETSLVFLFCCSCFMNERRHFKHFAGICGIFGFVEGSLSVFQFSCPCIIHERRHFRDLSGSCGCFGFVGGNVSGLPFQLSVLHERTKTKKALSRQLRLFRVRWRKRLCLVFLFCCSCFMNERRQKRHFPGSCGNFGFVGGNVSGLSFLLFVLHERTKTF